MSEWKPWEPDFSQPSQSTQSANSDDQILSLISSTSLNEENDEEVDDDNSEYVSEKDSIVFLIDCHKHMFNETLEEEKAAPFYFALKCAVHAYCDKIISSPSDLLGVVFYGTKEKKNQFDFDNIYIYNDIDIPDANKIKDMENLIEDKQEFERSFGHCKGKANIHEALWTCQHLFSHVPKNVGYKRIFLFTNDDNPINSDSTLRTKCIERAKDLIESDITVEMFVVKPKDKKFDTSLFWNHIIAKSDDDYTGRITFDVAERFKELREKVRKKEFKKRQRTTIPMIIGEGVALSVSLFTMVKRATKNKHVWLHSATNKPIRSETKYLCEDTGAELMPSDMKFYYTYGGKKAIFTKEECLEMRKLASPGLRLMGFKPRSRLKFYHNIQPSTFIYPNEKLIEGSTVAFAALHKKMLEMDRIAICRLIERERAQPIYVALVPQAEVLDSDQSQLEPPGFHMIYLPYADGIRNIAIPERAQEATDKQILKAKRMVKKLNIDFNSYDFENPALQHHYATLQALALDHKNVEKVTDLLKPDKEGMEKYKSVIEDFKDSVYPEDYDPEEELKKKTTTTSTRKRSAPKRKREVKKEEESDEDASAKKKLKKKVKEEPTDDDEAPKKKKRKAVKEEPMDDDEEETEEIDMVACVKNGKVKKLSNEILKEFCRVYKLKVSGKKADLIDRIVEFLQSKGKIPKKFKLE